MAELQLDADLRLRVTSPSGESATGLITGSGSTLRVDVDRPGVLFSSVDHADVGRIADVLSTAGISVRVVGPDGPVAVVGAGAASRMGKVLTGSAAVSASPRAALRLVGTQPAVRVVAIVVPIAAAVLVVLRRLWRS